MRRNKLLGKLTLSALLLLSANSQAEIVKYNFSAQGYALTWGPGCTRYDCPPLSAYGDHHLATMFNPTSTLTGSFFYDTTAKKTYSDDTFGDYEGPNVTGGNITTDTGFQFATDPADRLTPHFSVNNYPVGSGGGLKDRVTLVTAQTDRYGAAEMLTLDFSSKVGNGLFSNTDAPTALSLDNFKGEMSIFWANDGVYQFFYANITTLSLAPTAPVPEPATYAMFGIGLACLGLAKRRQQRRQAT